MVRVGAVFPKIGDQLSCYSVQQGSEPVVPDPVRGRAGSAQSSVFNMHGSYDPLWLYGPWTSTQTPSYSRTMTPDKALGSSPGGRTGHQVSMVWQWHGPQVPTWSQD